MSVIDLSNVTFYRGGTVVSGQAVGNDWNTDTNKVITRVARYSFKAPATGATSMTLSFRASQFGDGNQINLRYYIGTSSTSHTDAGKDAVYTGEFTLDVDYLKFTAETKILLYPNQTYYLWIFPAVDTYGWYYWAWDANIAETAGVAGLVYIDNGESIDPYEVYIDNGESWDRCMVYIDSGSGWDICG